jgi:hypothetical protein
MVNKRLSQLVGGKSSKYPLIDSRNEETGCIHGVINPMGTITSRAAHMFPNLGQVPSAKKPYGPQFRALFTKHIPTVYRGSAWPSLKGKVLPWKFLGADQEGLELRGLAHYLHPLDGGKYASTVIAGDPHWLHAVVMGLAEGERDKHNKLHTIVREDGSKRFIYAYIYGCGDEMAGSIIYEALLNARRNGGPDGEAIYLKFFGEGPVGERKLKAVGKAVRNSFRTRIDGFKQTAGQALGAGDEAQAGHRPRRAHHPDPFGSLSAQLHDPVRRRNRLQGMGRVAVRELERDTPTTGMTLGQETSSSCCGFMTRCSCACEKVLKKKSVKSSSTARKKRASPTASVSRSTASSVSGNSVGRHSLRTQGTP